MPVAGIALGLGLCRRDVTDFGFTLHVELVGTYLKYCIRTSAVVYHRVYADGLVIDHVIWRVVPVLSSCPIDIGLRRMDPDRVFPFGVPVYRVPR